MPTISHFPPPVNCFLQKNTVFFPVYATFFVAPPCDFVYDRANTKRKTRKMRCSGMKIMAIDYGDAHTGIAISDYTETLAGHSDVLHSRRQEEVLAGIRRLIAEHGVQLLVLGYPRNMDGTEGPRAEKCAAFGELLRQETGLEVILWDERRTTIDAHNILFQNGQNAKKRKKTVDAVAAALMLEGYLTRRRLEAQK